MSNGSGLRIVNWLRELEQPTSQAASETVILLAILMAALIRRIGFTNWISDRVIASL